MGQTTIEWTSTTRPDGTVVPGYTFNPWWGCTKVSKGCEHCYADTLSHRYGFNVWGPKADRRFFGDKHWAEPLKWNREAVKAGERRRVFCASMADVFERHMVPAINAQLEAARDRLWDVIAATPMLDWLLLTKRPENIADMIPWADGTPANAWKADVSMWPNVWLGASVENQEQAEKRIPHLLRIPTAVRFLSCEPLLGAVDFTDVGFPHPLLPYTCLACTTPTQRNRLLHPMCSIHGTRCIMDVDRIDWVIVGGESGTGARPMHPDWARSLRDQCTSAGIAFFMKQMGGTHDKRAHLEDIPIDLHYRNFPEVSRAI